MITQKTLDTVAYAIRKESNNSLNKQLETHYLRPALPTVSDDDFAEALLELGNKGLIKVLAKNPLHGAVLVSRLSITPAFIKAYP